MPSRALVALLLEDIMYMYARNELQKGKGAEAVHVGSRR
jgi:hypothetical protein